MEGPLGVKHPLLLVPVRQPPLEEVVQLMEWMLEPQLSTPAKQLVVVEAEVAVARPLAVRDDDGRPFDSAHPAPEHPLWLLQLFEVSNDEPEQESLWELVVPAKVL